MNEVVRGAYWTRIWGFLFPDKVSGDELRQRYRGGRLLLGITAGLGFSAVGWAAGGLLGSWAPRTACAAGAIALALGWLNRRPGAALLGAAGAGIAGLAAARLGESFFTPLLGWPLAGLVIGVMGAFAFRRLRAKIAFIFGAPLLGSVGFLAGMITTMLAAIGLNDSRVSDQMMLGGAAGFGFVLMTCAAIAGRWLDATGKAEGIS
jgi:hypothetical protein